MNKAKLRIILRNYKHGKHLTEIVRMHKIARHVTQKYHMRQRTSI